MAVFPLMGLGPFPAEGSVGRMGRGNGTGLGLVGPSLTGRTGKHQGDNTQAGTQSMTGTDNPSCVGLPKLTATSPGLPSENEKNALMGVGSRLAPNQFCPLCSVTLC